MPADDGVATDTPRLEKKVFHGWYIVGLGFLSHLAHAASISSTLGVFFKPMSEEFGWPRSFLSGVRSLEGVLNGVMILFIGAFIDRHGARDAMIVGGVIAGAGLILLGLVNDSLQFLLVRSLLVCVGMVGVSHMVSSIAISNWFIRKRGRALGLSGSGGAAGKIIIAPLVTFLMEVWGWRASWMLLGLAVLVLVPLPTALVVRRRPEDMGLRPDGVDEPVDLGATSQRSRPVPGGPLAGEAVWTRSEAAHTSAFWLIILTFSVASVGFQGWALHMIPYLTDIGVSSAWAAIALSFLAVFQLVGTLGWGFIVERFPMRYCAMVMFLLQASGVAIFLWFRSPVFLAFGLAAYGFGLAGNAVMQDIIWANYFGRLSLGMVRSLGMPLMNLSAAGGPFYFGYLYDLTGAYDLSLVGFMVALITAAGLVLACRPPTRREKVRAVENG